MDVDVAETHQLLLQRFRCVAFAARRAGVTRDELDAALDVADAARDRELAALAAERPQLRLVSAAGRPV